ncbi:SusC/RagA family TonB-linked outer membrane protein [Aridibaculum aurantiacum]|uniref:SusC/RagA family TonB-linked outer membrane protein n=1 Tax=Aridibaculum aurantiacum TaxID=2810307 RepID=UPI001A976A05|nr:SusC/RagA family TonB-linked outer membrane protein [Aridibaculum aurantiacum]
MNQRMLRCSFALLFILLGFVSTFAQQRVITGTITAQDTKEPIAGVTVSIKGLTVSTSTNEKGEFSIPVGGSETVLRFSSIGYTYQEVNVGERSSINVVMNKDQKQLDEVVVVGYATQKKAHLTGAIETIKASEIEDLPVSNLGAALAGRVLGLGVSGGNTRPGSAAQLTIRNPLSLSKDGGSTSPLFVIDGIIQVAPNGANDDTWFNNLDASEVENITILKDAAAAVYGSRGAYGVVLVTTKRGKAGSPKISYSGSYGWNDEAYRTKMLSAYEFGQYMNIMNGPNGEAAQPSQNRFFTPDELDRFKRINYDWLDPVWKSAYNTRHSLNVSGGVDKATFFANVSYYAQNGNLSTLDFKRWTYRAGGDVRIGNSVKAGLQVAGNSSSRVKTFNKIGGENDENDYRNLLLTPRYIPSYIDGLPVRIPGTDQLSQYHFYEIERLGNLAADKDRALNVNMYVEYEAPFLKGLKGRVNFGKNFGFNNGSQIGTQYRLYNFVGSGTNRHILDSGATLPATNASQLFSNGNRLYYSNNNSENYQLNFMANYARQFGKHSVSGLFSVEKSEASNYQQDVWRDQPIPSTNGQFNTAFGTIDGRTSGNESGSLGYIGRVNYAYDDKYLAEILFRSDASTRFAPENYWGNFYSTSLGYVISKEKWFNIPAIDFLKLRYSFGKLGADNTRPWQWRQRYTFQNNGGTFGGTSVGAMSPGMRMEVAPNRNATWSEEYKNNLGVDAKFFRSRMSVTMEGFYNKGRNMLIERTEAVPVTVGGSVASENYAAVDFFGYELGLGWNDKIGRDFRWSIDTRFSWYDNIAHKDNFSPTADRFPWVRGPGQSRDNGKWGYDYLGMFKTPEDVQAYIAKHGITQVFGTPASQLKPGMLYYRDVRGPAIQNPDGSWTFAGPDGIIDENDQIQLAKRVNNNYGFGVTLRASYKGVSLDAVIAGSWGGYAEVDGNARKKMNNDISRNFQSRPAIWNNIYDPELNPTGTMPNPHWEAISLSPTSDFWRVSSFRARVRNINLNYSLSRSVAQMLHVSSARVVLTALNPFNLANPYTYKDSEGPYDIFPTLRTYSVGVNVTF